MPVGVAAADHGAEADGEAVERAGAHEGEHLAGAGDLEHQAAAGVAGRGRPR